MKLPRLVKYFLILECCNTDRSQMLQQAEGIQVNVTIWDSQVEEGHLRIKDILTSVINYKIKGLSIGIYNM